MNISLLFLFMGGPELIVIMLLEAFFMLPFLLYINNLRLTILEISPENRLINPASVWTLLIPVWGSFFNFYMVSKIADSLRLEFDKRNIMVGEFRPSYSLGLAMSILSIVRYLPIFLQMLAITNLLPINVSFISVIVSLLLPFGSLGALVCWIVYWVSVSKYKSMLQMDNFRRMGEEMGNED